MELQVQAEEKKKAGQEAKGREKNKSQDPFEGQSKKKIAFCDFLLTLNILIRT